MIDWKTRDGVCELSLGNEPCNEIGTSLLETLERFLRELDTDEVRAVLIHSTLRRGFSAGADLRELHEAMNERPEHEHEAALGEVVDRVHGVMDTLDTLPVPTVAAVHGICFGGGFELALTCDVIIAERSARFAFPELRLGLLPGFGGIPRLRREVPNAVIRDLLLTGRSINARKAGALGLVSQVTAPGEGLHVARQAARQAARFDAEALRATKSFIKPLPRRELEDEKARFLRLCRRPQVREALRRFVESRDAMPYLPQGM